MNSLLEINNLKTYFYLDKQITKAVDGVNLAIKPGEILALVGESGCGKSVTALSITKLIYSPGKIVDGEVIFAGQDILKLEEKKLRLLRGAKISYIFQEAVSSLNPIFSIGEQMVETIKLHQNKNNAQAKDDAIKLLRQVEISSPEERFNNYPHQLSGGMNQRVMLAMAISSNPQLLIADEPTTALDVTIQVQILELLKELREKRNLSILLISHDLNMVRGIADKIALMHLGKITKVETL
jgi:ABC-type dipeptide/oligopeptide/nickel transport system ATPase component